MQLYLTSKSEPVIHGLLNYKILSIKLQPSPISSIIKAFIPIIEYSYIVFYAQYKKINQFVAWLSFEIEKLIQK